MANTLIAYGNVIDVSVVSGGSWLASLPLTNVQQRIIKKVARSTNLQLASTKFVIDAGANQAFRTVGVIGHNLSLVAKYRIRASNDVNFTTLLVDSGWLEAWPPLYASTALDWQANNWWSGRYTEKDRTGYTWNTIYSAAMAVFARYWSIEFDDQTNPAGYVDIGRVFLGEAWQPKINMDLGANIGWSVGTEVSEAISGAEFFNEKVPYRVARFVTSFMSNDEAMGSAFDIKRRVGISGEVIFQWRSDDTTHALRRSFLGRLRELSAIEYPYPHLASTAWEIKELI